LGSREDGFADTVVTPAGSGDDGVGLDRVPTDERPVPDLLGGRYRAKGRLGAGGFGVVYEAVDERLQKRVAVKVLSERNCHDKTEFERFRAEAMAAGRLAHPNIVAVTDFDVLEDGRPFLVMELVRGQPLDVVIRTRRQFEVVPAARIARKLCLALSAAHEHNIIHRDLKAANVMVREEGKETGEDGDSLKILDFGVAKLMEGSEPRQLTHTGQTLGTPTYMAPEQVRRRGKLDGRADVYSVGIILYEMLAGTTPFAGRAAGDIMVSKVIEKPKPPSKHNRAIPSALERIIMRAIQPDRDNRFDTATAMADALEPYTREEVTLAKPTELDARLRWIAMATALLGAIGLAAFVLTRGGSRGESEKTAEPEPREPPALVSPATAPALSPDAAPAAAPVPATPPVAEPSAEADAAPTPVVAKKKRKRKPKPKRKPKGDLPDSPIERLRPPR